MGERGLISPVALPEFAVLCQITEPLFQQGLSSLMYLEILLNARNHLCRMKSSLHSLLWWMFFSFVSSYIFLMKFYPKLSRFYLQLWRDNRSCQPLLFLWHGSSNHLLPLCFCMIYTPESPLIKKTKKQTPKKPQQNKTKTVEKCCTKASFEACKII